MINLAKSITIPAFMLVMIIYNKENKSTMDVHRTLKITYSAVNDINKSLINIKWLEKKFKNNKEYYLVPTEKGKKIVEPMEKMLENIGIVLKEDEENDKHNERI